MAVVSVVRALGFNRRARENAKQTIWTFGGEDVTIGVDRYRGEDYLHYPSDNMRLFVRSTSPEDCAGGRGARQILVAALNRRLVPRFAEVNMAGTEPARIPGNVYRIQRMYVIDLGGSGTALGNIVVVDGETGAIYHGIPAGRQRSFCATYCVPAGKRLRVTSWRAHGVQADGTNPRCWAVIAANYVEGRRLPTFVAYDTMLAAAGGPELPLAEPPGTTPDEVVDEMVFPAGVDVRVTCEPIGIPAVICGAFSGRLESA